MVKRAAGCYRTFGDRPPGNVTGVGRSERNDTCCASTARQHSMHTAWGGNVLARWGKGGRGAGATHSTPAVGVCHEQQSLKRTTSTNERPHAAQQRSHAERSQRRVWGRAKGRTQWMRHQRNCLCARGGCAGSECEEANHVAHTSSCAMRKQKRQPRAACKHQAHEISVFRHDTKQFDVNVRVYN